MGHISFDLDFIISFFSIILIDLVLAGDNAIVIAMASKSLPPHKRKKGLILGAGAAVTLRIVLTLFVSKILNAPYLKLAGGVLIAYMASKLITEEWFSTASRGKPIGIRKAVKRIAVADVTMSLDNMLAVAGVAKDSLFLLVSGLGISIIFVTLTSSIFLKIIDRYPFIIYLGAALLGKVAAEMIVTDRAISWMMPKSVFFLYAVEAVTAIAVVIAGRTWLKWKSTAENNNDMT